MKQSIITIFFSCFLASLISQTPVAEYHFTDGSFDDSSISSYNLVSSGVVNPIEDRFGNPDQAINLNNGNLSAGQADILNMNEPITISCWVKFDSFQNLWTAVLNKWNAASGSYYLGVNPANSSMRWNAFVANVEDPNPIEIGVWMHYCAIYDGQNMKLYRDGELVASSEVGEIYGTNNLPLMFGAQSNVPDNNFLGSLDDIYVFKAALSDEQVVDLYQGVVTGAVKDLGIIDLDMDPIQEAGDKLQVSGRLYNYGSETINTFDLRIGDGISEVVVNIDDQNLEQLEDYTFDLEVDLPLDVGDLKSITVSCENVNGSEDDNAFNNSRTEDVKAYAFLPKRRLVIEEGTGTWCGWCPRGIVALARMDEDHPDDVIGIAVHEGDPMELEIYTDGTNFEGFPSANYDRTILGDDISPDIAESYYQNRVVDRNDLSVASISHEFVFGPGDTQIIVTAKIIPALNLEGDYKLAVVITEDGVMGTDDTYAQANNYNAGTEPMGNFESMPNPVPASLMTYDHVARDIIGGYDGVISFPSSMSYNEEYEATISGGFPIGIAYENANVITLLLGPDGEIVNAVRSPLNNTPSSTIKIAEFFDVNIYPNPVGDMTFVSLDLKESQEVELQILDLAGRTIAQKNYGLLTGEQVLPIIPEDNWNGIYIFRIRVGKEIRSKKVIFK